MGFLLAQLMTTSKCQVTLPRRLREVVGIKPRQEVETFIIDHGGRPVIAIAPAGNRKKGSAMAERWVGCLKGQGTTNAILREIRGHE